jgi:hypothetical protein
LSLYTAFVKGDLEMSSRMNEKEIWALGRKAAQEVASKYLSIEVNFTAAPLTGKNATLVEVYITSKGARNEHLYPLGVLLYKDETLRAAILQHELEQVIEQKVCQFLNIG